MKFSKAIPVILVLAGTAVQPANADEGDSKLIGPMFKPIEIENPKALDLAKDQSLKDRGLIDGLVGPAMQPPATETKSKKETRKKGQRTEKSN